MPGPQFPHWLVSHTVITTQPPGHGAGVEFRKCRDFFKQTPSVLFLYLSPVPCFVHRRGAAASLKAAEDGCFGVLSIGMTQRMLTPSQRNIYHKECSEILIQAKRMTEDIPAFNGPLTEVAPI